MGDQKLLGNLKREVIERSSSTRFIHHKWFVKYHLEIVETIAKELCSIYAQADKFRVLVLVWLHDYEKIIDSDNEQNTELAATRDIMKQIGFDKKFISGTCSDINTINLKNNLKSADIEIQIVSSSDAASHFIEPFGSMFWYENPEMPIKDIQAERHRKISVDWEKKITLPEVKKDFLNRYRFAKEATGDLPGSYLNH